jgi:hypothetical protein
MARLAAAVGPDDRQDPAVGVVVRAVTSPAVEQDETHAPQQGFHLAEPNRRRRATHLLDQLLGSVHVSSSRF